VFSWPGSWNCWPVCTLLLGDWGPRSASYACHQVHPLHPGGSGVHPAGRPWPWASRVAAPQLLNTQPLRPRISHALWSCWPTPACCSPLGVKLAGSPPPAAATPGLPALDAHGEAIRARHMLLAGILLEDWRGMPCLRFKCTAARSPRPVWLPLLVVLGWSTSSTARPHLFAQRNLKRKNRLQLDHANMGLRAEFGILAAFQRPRHSGAMLQVGQPWPASVPAFLLPGGRATYDRQPTTLQLDEMGGVGQKDAQDVRPSGPSVRWPRWPYRGMRLVSSRELMAVCGLRHQRGLTLSAPHSVMGRACAVGVILTPIYLLFFHAAGDLFFGKEETPELGGPQPPSWWMAEPREIYVISCLLVAIIGIGLLPQASSRPPYAPPIEALVLTRAIGDGPGAVLLRRTCCPQRQPVEWIGPRPAPGPRPWA